MLTPPVHCIVVFEVLLALAYINELYLIHLYGMSQDLGSVSCNNKNTIFVQYLPFPNLFFDPFLSDPVRGEVTIDSLQQSSSNPSNN